ncbi:hypothetical protein AeMF1_007564 [Aphanomyces euteiches]|nr:hypothetical protein AeMF1_007564 [Aphanomyces euteiches]
MSAFYSIVPRYPRRSTRCLSGCYLPSVTQSTCVANSKYMWDSTHGNGSGICVGRRNVIKTASACSSENGVFLNATRTYFPGAFTTQEQCSQGGCMGAPFTDGWNTSQCLNLTFGTCSAQCSSCTSRTMPFSLQNSSGCFSSDATYCSSVNSSTTPCLVVDAMTSSACLALTSTAWQSCNQYTASNTCTNASDLIASTLNCTWSTQQCPTQAQCVAQGTCNDQDNLRMQCLDSGWTYGDTCSVNVAVSFTDGSNVTRTSMKTAVCNTCNRINGVCVAPVDPMNPCNSALSHPMGCRMSGVADATSCFLQGGTWYTRATTQADCLAIKACKEPGVNRISHKNATECAKCNGVPKSLYTWTPGQWKGPYVESYVWNPNGAQLSSVNQWRTTISDTKLAAALARPIARRKSNMEAQKALLMYNAMSDVLATLACACGSGASTACFNSTTTGTLVAETTVFCGLNSTIDTGFASAVVSNACPAPVPSSRRRLAVSTSDTSTVAWTVYPLASFTMFPLSPVCGSSELSPLVVTSAQGVVYGQLLGPGQGFNVTSGQATSVQLCLSLSANVHNWSSLFDTVDIASYQGGVFTPLNLLSFLPSTSDQLCFAPTQNGTYFPIQRASAAAATTSSCSPVCATNSSICVYNMTAQSAQCLCRCGFTGSTCVASCLNQCSYQGMCSNNVCTCNSGYTGDDCSILVTPAPKATPSTVPTPTTSSVATVTTPSPTNVPTVSADPATPSPTPTKSPGDTMHLTLLVVVMSSILLVGLL